MVTNIYKKLEERSSERYYIELWRIERDNYTFYNIMANHIGRNAKWYRTRKTEFTEINAYKAFNKELKRIQEKTIW